MTKSITKTMETKNAIHITGGTLLGIDRNDKYPLSSGNCFSVETEDGNYYRIVNFGMENLEEAVKRGVSWPIKIHPISEHVALIHDDRIPYSWYDKEWCEICCPGDLLPLPQKLERAREESRGERIVTTSEVEGRPLNIVRHDYDKHPDLRTEEEKAEANKPIAFYGIEEIGEAYIDKDLVMGTIERWEPEQTECMLGVIDDEDENNGE